MKQSAASKKRSGSIRLCSFLNCFWALNFLESKNPEAAIPFLEKAEKLNPGMCKPRSTLERHTNGQPC